MNTKRGRPKVPKLSQKADRGAQHRRMEGKSNIAAKRVTLLPGFLINGFASKTVKKNRGTETAQKPKKQDSNADLQTFFDQRGKKVRRSQRLSKKLPESPSSICDNLGLSSQPISFKSILKNNSKSIFKDINEKFSKVQLCTELDLNYSEDIVDLEPHSCLEEHFLANLSINKSFSLELRKQLCVPVPKTSSLDDIMARFFPVPPQKWTYCTPPNQRIGAGQIEDCQLQVGVLYTSKKQQNIYQLKENVNVDFGLIKGRTKVPIDERLFQKVAQINKTPAANFVRVESDGEQGIKRPTSNEETVGSTYVPVIKRPSKTVKHISFTSHLRQLKDPAEDMDTFDQDFSLIEEGSNFNCQFVERPSKMSKRRLSDEEFVIKKRSIIFPNGGGNNNNNKACSQGGKLFDFSQQEKSCFDNRF